MYGKWFPWNFTDWHTHSGGWGRWLGNFHVWVTQYVPHCMVEVYGIFNVKKKYLISLFSVLNRVAIWMHFALNRVRIQGFQQYRPNQSSFKSPPPPPTTLEKFLPLCIRIVFTLMVFFRVKNKEMEQRGIKSDLPWSRVWYN